LTKELFVHPSSVCFSTEIGRGTRIWHFCHVMEGAKIGEDCMFGQGCFVAAGVCVGNRVRVQNHVSLFSGVVLEDDVFCGPGVVFTNVERPRAWLSQKATFATTRVEVGATLGANATLCPGVTIGRYALVGAGAVVAKDVPAFAQVVGVPARVVGWVSRSARALSFDASNEARCPLTGERYALKSATTEDWVELLDHPASA
jgi:UDP-2-acetamido-3-amino-2,3-dideoxy-glucuronate N-acetyltransferase